MFALVVGNGDVGNKKAKFLIKRVDGKIYADIRILRSTLLIKNFDILWASLSTFSPASLCQNFQRAVVAPSQHHPANRIFKGRVATQLKTANRTEPMRNPALGG